eukprot:CAMPEP_0119548408 /NCGR_PEP_ID=MMETSP1352-20130426/2334_1 /TAXON_ID=265584 /ORGANISM="Stauroneis constricta, Strain CCMP1120" /LENGTH=859 /DNA_ID=CAMNT_0007593677 /DNA_START=54 /DNA_END=2629 /DNA_ORIENTATION=+
MMRRKRPKLVHKMGNLKESSCLDSTTSSCVSAKAKKSLNEEFTVVAAAAIEDGGHNNRDDSAAHNDDDETEMRLLQTKMRALQREQSDMMRSLLSELEHVRKTSGDGGVAAAAADSYDDAHTASTAATSDNEDDDYDDDYDHECSEVTESSSSSPATSTPSIHALVKKFRSTMAILKRNHRQQLQSVKEELRGSRNELWVREKEIQRYQQLVASLKEELKEEQLRRERQEQRRRSEDDVCSIHTSESVVSTSLASIREKLKKRRESESKLQQRFQHNKHKQSAAVSLSSHFRSQQGAASTVENKQPQKQQQDQHGGGVNETTPGEGHGRADTNNSNNPNHPPTMDENESTSSSLWDESSVESTESAAPDTSSDQDHPDSSSIIHVQVTLNKETTKVVAVDDDAADMIVELDEPKSLSFVTRSVSTSLELPNDEQQQLQPRASLETRSQQPKEGAIMVSPSPPRSSSSSSYLSRLLNNTSSASTAAESVSSSDSIHRMMEMSDDLPEMMAIESDESKDSNSSSGSCNASVEDKKKDPQHLQLVHDESSGQDQAQDRHPLLADDRTAASPEVIPQSPPSIPSPFHRFAPPSYSRTADQPFPRMLSTSDSTSPPSSGGKTYRRLSSINLESIDTSVIAPKIQPKPKREPRPPSSSSSSSFSTATTTQANSTSAQSQPQHEDAAMSSATTTTTTTTTTTMPSSTQDAATTTAAAATIKPSVSFSSVHIRLYQQTLGDHPCVTYGPPITLDWNHIQIPPIDIHRFETFRTHRRATQVNDLFLSSVHRRTILQHAGISDHEINTAIQDVEDYRKSMDEEETICIDSPSFQKPQTTTISECIQFAAVACLRHPKIGAADMMMMVCK